MFGVGFVELLMEAQVGDASNLLEVRRDFLLRGSAEYKHVINLDENGNSALRTFRRDHSDHRQIQYQVSVFLVIIVQLLRSPVPFLTW